MYMVRFWQHVLAHSQSVKFNQVVIFPPTDSLAAAVQTLLKNKNTSVSGIPEIQCEPSGY